MSTVSEGQYQTGYRCPVTHFESEVLYVVVIQIRNVTLLTKVMAELHYKRMLLYLHMCMFKYKLYFTV